MLDEDVGSRLHIGRLYFPQGLLELAWLRCRHASVSEARSGKSEQRGEGNYESGSCSMLLSCISVYSILFSANIFYDVLRRTTFVVNIYYFITFCCELNHRFYESPPVALAFSHSELVTWNISSTSNDLLPHPNVGALQQNVIFDWLIWLSRTSSIMYASVRNWVIYNAATAHAS